MKKYSDDLVIIAIYTSLSLLLGSFSFGYIQIRLFEAMMIFCLFDKKYIKSLTLACLLSNILGVILGMNQFVIDIFLGTLATYISGQLIYLLRNVLIFNKPIIALLMPPIINGVIIGFEFALYLSNNNFFNLFILYFFYIAIGELVSSILGLFILNPLKEVINKQTLNKL